MFATLLCGQVILLSWSREVSNGELALLQVNPPKSTRALLPHQESFFSWDPIQDNATIIIHQFAYLYKVNKTGIIVYL